MIDMTKDDVDVDVEVVDLVQDAEVEAEAAPSILMPVASIVSLTTTSPTEVL